MGVGLVAGDWVMGDMGEIGEEKVGDGMCRFEGGSEGWYEEE